MSDRCEACGTHGTWDFKNQFVSDDWVRANEIRENLEREKKALDALLVCVNKVTAYHRHGQKIPTRALDELANRQVEIEKKTGRL